MKDRRDARELIDVLCDGDFRSVLREFYSVGFLALLGAWADEGEGENAHGLSGCGA